MLLPHCTLCPVHDIYVQTVHSTPVDQIDASQPCHMRHCAASHQPQVTAQSGCCHGSLPFDCSVTRHGCTQSRPVRCDGRLAPLPCPQRLCPWLPTLQQQSSNLSSWHTCSECSTNALVSAEAIMPRTAHALRWACHADGQSGGAHAAAAAQDLQVDEQVADVRGVDAADAAGLAHVPRLHLRLTTPQPTVNNCMRLACGMHAWHSMAGAARSQAATLVAGAHTLSPVCQPNVGWCCRAGAPWPASPAPPGTGC